MIQSSLARLVDTTVAMSEMRTEGNERTFDAACSVALRSSPQRMLLAANPVPAYFTHFFFLYLRYHDTLRTLIFKKTLREQTPFECFSVSDTLHIQCMVDSTTTFHSKWRDCNQNSTRLFLKKP